MSSQDYSFMKTGTSNSSGIEINMNDIQVILSLFISNSFINAAKYSQLSKRNGITKEDINLGLKYEVRKFFENESLSIDIDEMKREYEEMKNEEPVKFRALYFTENEEFSKLFNTLDEANQFLDNIENSNPDVTETEIEELTKTDLKQEEMLVNEDTLDKFRKVTMEDLYSASQEQRKFVVNIHKYETEWESWEPNTPIHVILKNSVDKMIKNDSIQE